MKSELMLVLILVPSILLGMDRQEKVVLHKFHLVLTAGKYTYSEHMAIHADVIDRLKSICLSYETANQEEFAKTLRGYAHILGSFAKKYREDTPISRRSDLLVAELNTCHLDGMLWALSIDEGRKISPDSLAQLMKSLRKKKEAAHLRLKQAEEVLDSFRGKKDLAPSLPIEHAVTAWYLSFPPLLFEDDAEPEESSDC